MTIKGQTKFNLELTGSEDPLKAADRRTDKLALALLAAALILGSSVLALMPADVRILGLPVPSAVGFLLSGVVTGVLLFRMRRRKR